MIIRLLQISTAVSTAIKVVLRLSPTGTQVNINSCTGAPRPLRDTIVIILTVVHHPTRDIARTLTGLPRLSEITPASTSRRDRNSTAVRRLPAKLPSTVIPRENLLFRLDGFPSGTKSTNVGITLKSPPAIRSGKPLAPAATTPVDIPEPETTRHTALQDTGPMEKVPMNMATADTLATNTAVAMVAKVDTMRVVSIRRRRRITPCYMPPVV